LFKQRKNKTFNYQLRYSKTEEANSESEISQKSLSSQWKRANVSKAKSAFSLRALIIILVLILICMYLLESKYIVN